MLVAAQYRKMLSVILCVVSAVLVCQNAFAATPPPPPQLTKAGAKILVNFSDPQQSKVTFVGFINAAPGAVFTGVKVAVNIGGIARKFVLSPDGEGVATPDLFQMREVVGGYTFIMSTQDNALANVYQQYGLTNQNLAGATVSMPANISFNSITFGGNLNGVYYSQTDNFGKCYLGIVQPPKDPYKTVSHITTLKATPNPTKANQATTIKGIVSLANFTGDVRGNVNFGDQTPPIHTDGATLASMLKTGISHTYTADGVYVARISFVGGDEIADTKLFIVVGDNYIVNPKSGAVGRLVKSPGGGVTLQLGVGNVPGAQTAQTNFVDMMGNPAGRPPAPPPPGGQIGLAPSNTFVMPGIYVAQVTAIDPNGNPLGTVKKTINITSSDVGTSAVQEPNGAPQVAARDTSSDSTITLTSMSGKFQFTSTAADQVIFNGKITLPAGFNPKSETGNDITIAMGNVSDTVHLDSKNKLALPTSLGYVTKFRLTVPKLPNGVATGTEVARLSMTMNTGDLDVKGFDSEGISVSVRSDEAGQTSVARFIQVDMLLGGQSFSSLIQVEYSTLTSSGSLLGVISGRSSK